MVLSVLLQAARVPLETLMLHEEWPQAGLVAKAQPSLLLAAKCQLTNVLVQGIQEVSSGHGHNSQ